jgi:hypothetical protein
MASSWITTPHLRPSSDTISSESHPGVLAHERAGPFAISAGQICVKIAEDGQPSLPSDVVLDKRYTHSAPTVVTLQVKDGPPAPSDIHTNVLTASPLLKHKQVARPQSPSSSSTFERQVLASVPTTNFQPVAPISAASNLTPPLSPDSPDAARPILNTDISMAGSSTIGYSQLPMLNQTLTQSPNPGRGQPARQAPRRSGTMGTFGTSAGNSIAQTEYTDMVFEAIPFRINVMTCVFMWTVLAGFLVLPSSFPDIQTILGDSNKLSKVVRVARNIPLYVPFFPLVPLFNAKKGSSGSFVHFKLTCGIKLTDLPSASPAAASARPGCVTSGCASDIIMSGFSAVSSSQGCSVASLA